MSICHNLHLKREQNNAITDGENEYKVYFYVYNHDTGDVRFY